MGKIIRTVKGDISSDQLGYCHSHEHIFVKAGGEYENVNKALVIDDYDLSLTELKGFYAAGGRTLVDAQPSGAGRSCRILKKLSEESGVNIIASTGFHIRKFYPKTSRLYALNASEAADLFIAELMCGMFEGIDPNFDAEMTAIKAGNIKCALDTPDSWDIYKNLFDGATTAALETKAPMMIHTGKNADIEAFLNYLESRRIDLGKVIICHLDRTCPDIKTHIEVAKRGAYLEYDTVGRYKYNDDETECSIIKNVLDAGYEDRILLGLDTTSERLSAYGGTPGLTFIKEKFEDIAGGYGIPKDEFKKFMTENPAKAFSFGN